MQAAVKLANSPVLKIVNDYEIPKPTSKQVLLKVQASGVCHSDVSSAFPYTCRYDCAQKANSDARCIFSVKPRTTPGAT